MSNNKGYGPLYGKIIRGNNDGQNHITRGKDFYLSGGDKEQHERLREIVVKTEEGLKKDGKNFRNVDTQELRDRIVEQIEKNRH